MGAENYFVNDFKVYVAVTAHYSVDGVISPQSFVWEDGENYEVDRILSVCPAASLKGGGAGMRYTIRVRGRVTFMFLEEDGGIYRWFMERRT